MIKRIKERRMKIPLPTELRDLGIKSSTGATKLLIAQIILEITKGTIQSEVKIDIYNLNLLQSR